MYLAHYLKLYKLITTLKQRSSDIVGPTQELYHIIVIIYNGNDSSHFRINIFLQLYYLKIKLCIFNHAITWFASQQVDSV